MYGCKFYKDQKRQVVTHICKLIADIVALASKHASCAKPDFFSQKWPIRVLREVGRPARVALGTAAGQARVEKFILRVTECWAKAHKLNQLKHRKTCGCTEVVCQHCAWDSRPTTIIAIWCNSPLLRNISSDSCHVVGKWTISNPMLTSYLVKNNSV